MRGLGALAVASLCLAQMCDAFTHPTALLPTAAARAALPAHSRCSGAATQPRLRIGGSDRLGRKAARLTRVAAAGDGGMEKEGKLQKLLGNAKLVSSPPAIRGCVFSGRIRSCVCHCVVSS